MYTFAPGYTFASIGADALHLDITGEMVNAGGAETFKDWETATIPLQQRCSAVAFFISELLDFTIPDASKTITLQALNDAGDVLFSVPIDVAHGAVDRSVASVPLVVGPFAINGTTNPLPFRFRVTTDAASLSLVNPNVGAAWGEIITQAVNVIPVST